MKPLRCALRFAFVLLAASVQAQTTATDPWVRATVSPAQKATGLFVQLQSVQGGRLVAAASPAAGLVEIHEMKLVDGVMRMRALPDGLALPAGEPVSLKPGGLHIMLIDLKQPIKEGEAVPVTLTVEGKDGRRETLQLSAPARLMAAPMKSH
jgi:copper(I)-binding protein